MAYLYSDAEAKEAANIIAQMRANSIEPNASQEVKTVTARHLLERQRESLERNRTFAQKRFDEASKEVLEAQREIASYTSTIADIDRALAILIDAENGSST